ncbi:hypothetical protein GCM10009087_41270 [Sphingomonas oligophenolica]|uniref:Glycosyltransferase family 1 protein n=2 Tax=Sphingomonas oligophenolica TaxID=301154 RepID=A0ABU9YCQ0_9SPHN
MLFAVLGADARSYVRAQLLAGRLGLSYSIYAVDDPFQWDGAGAGVRKKLYPELLASFGAAEHIFAITPELSAELSSRVERSVTPLPLPYTEPSVDSERTKDQLIYVGNLGHLYAAAFRDLVDAVSRFRIASGRNLVLRATLPAENLKRVIGDIPNHVIPGRIAARQDLAREIAESRAAICPIAFSDPSGMTETSFPSKLLDYLAHARQILIWGPPKAVAVRYFVEHGLGYVASTPDQLTDSLDRLLAAPQDFRESYRKILKRNHGPEAFDAIIQRMLSGFAGAAER